LLLMLLMLALAELFSRTVVFGRIYAAYAMPTHQTDVSVTR
jgi:hypothetical protein